MGRFLSQPAFGQPLPFTPGKSFGDIFNYAATIQTKLGQLSFNSVQELNAALATAFGISGANLVVGYNTGARELTYALTLQQPFSTSLPLGVAVDASGRGLGDLTALSGTGQVAVSGRLQLSFTLGMSLAGAVSAASRVFVRDFAAAGEIHLTAQNLNVNARIGALQVASTGASVQVDGTLSFGLKAPGQSTGGTLTLAQLRTNLAGTFSVMANLPAVAGTGQLVLPNLTAPGTLVTLPANTRVTYQLPNLLDTSTVQETGNTGALADLGMVQPQNLADLLGALADTLGQFRAQLVFSAALPLVQGKTVDSLFSLVQTTQTKLAGLTVTSLQDLSTQLAQQFGLSGNNLQVAYNATTHEVTYGLVLSQTFTMQLPVAFPATLANLAGLSTTDPVTLSGDFTLSFTLGMSLSGNQVISNRLFVRNLSATGNVHLSSPTSHLTGLLGFLPLQSDSGTIQADGTLSFGLVQPGSASGGTLTLTQLRTAKTSNNLASIATLPALTGPGGRVVLNNVTVPADASGRVFITLPAGAQLTVTLPDLLNLATATTSVSSNAGQLLSLGGVQTSNFKDLLNAVADTIGQFRAQPALNQPLPFAEGTTVGDAFGFLQTVQTQLSQLNFTTIQDLINQLTTQFGLVGNALVAKYDAVAQELSFQVVLLRTFNRAVPLAVRGSQGDITSLSSTGQLNLTGQVSLAFTFGIKLTGTQSLGNRLFVRGFSATGQLHLAGQGLAVAATLGFVNLLATGSVQADAALAFGLKDLYTGQAGGTVTLTDLRATLANDFRSVANLPVFAGSAQLVMQNLGVVGNLVPVAANAQLTISIPDLQKPTAVRLIPVNIAPQGGTNGSLLDFQSARPGDLQVLLSTLSAGLDRIRTQPVFSQPLPFTQNLTVGGVLNVFQTLPAKLAGMQFNSAQDLTAQLIQQFGQAGTMVTTNYDLQKQELTYTVTLAQTFNQQIPVGFGLNWNGLTNLSSDTPLTLTGRANLSFTFGIALGNNLALGSRLFVRDLTASGEIHLSAANVRLAAQLGFLRVQSAGSSIQLDGSLAFSLKPLDSNQVGGTLTQTQLNTALAANNLRRAANLPTFQGNAQLVLQNLTVPGNLIPLSPGNPRITYSVPDLQNPGAVIVTPVNVGILMSLANIPPTQVADLVGTTGVVLDVFRGQSLFNQALGFVPGRNLGQVFGFLQTAAAGLEQLRFTSAQDLILQLGQTFGNNLQSLTVGYNAAAQELTYRVVLQNTTTSQVPLTVPTLGDLSGFTGDAGAQVTLSAQTNLSFTLGIQLDAITGTQTVADKLFIRDLAAGGTVSLGGQDLRLSALLGMLQIQSSGSTLQANGSLAFGLTQPGHSAGGTLTLPTLKLAANPLNIARYAALPAFGGSAVVGLQNLRIPGNLVTLPSASASLTVAVPNVLNTSQVSLTAQNAGTLLDFQSSRTSQFNDLLTALGSVFNQFRAQPVFAKALPFVPGETVGDAFDFFRGVQANFGRLHFSSAQDLTTQLALVFGLSAGNLSAQYNSTTHELTYTLSLQQSFQATVPLNYPGYLADIGALSSDAPLALTGLAHLNVTFGLSMADSSPVNDRLFVRDLLADGQFHIGAQNVGIKALLGFLQLQTGGSSVQADGYLGFSLDRVGRNPDTDPPGGTVTLTQIQAALGHNSLAGIATLPAVSGGAKVSLQNLNVQNNFLPQPSSLASITVTLPDPLDPTGAQLLAQNVGDLMDFAPLRPANMADLVTALSTTLAKFRADAAFTTPMLFSTGTTVDRIFGIFADVQSKLGGLTFTSAQDLAAHLVQMLGQFGAVTTGYDLNSQELTYQVSLTQPFSLTVPLNFAHTLEKLTSLTGTTPVTLTGSVNVSFTFGVKLDGLTGTQTIKDKLFVRDFTGTGSFGAQADSIPTTATLGFLEFQSANTSIQVSNGSLQFGLAAPGHKIGGTLTLTQLQAGLAGNFGTISQAPDLEGTVSVQLHNLTVVDNLIPQPPAAAAIAMLVDLHNPAAVAVTHTPDLNTLYSFEDLRFEHIDGLIQGLAGILGRFLDAPSVFAQPVPFFQQYRFSDLFDLLSGTRNALAALRFSSAQDLTRQLASALNLVGGSIVTGFDAPSGSLTYQVRLRETINKNLPLSITSGIAGLRGLTSDTLVNVTGSVTLNFTLLVHVPVPLNDNGTVDMNELDNQSILQDFSASGNLHIATDGLNAGAQVGVLQLLGKAAVADDASFTLGFDSRTKFDWSNQIRNPVRLTYILWALNNQNGWSFSDLASAPLLHATGRLTLQNATVTDNVPVPGFANGSTLTWNVGEDTTQHVLTYQLTPANSPLLNFDNIRGSDLATYIRTLGSLLPLFGNSATLNQTIAFAQGKTYGDVLRGFLQSIPAKIQQFSIRNVQDVIDQFNQAFGQALHLTVAYDGTTLNLRIDLTMAVPATTVPLAFNVPMGNLSQLTGTTQLSLSGTYNLGFNLLIQLNTDATLTANDRFLIRNLAGTPVLHLSSNDFQLNSLLGLLNVQADGTLANDVTVNFSLHDIKQVLEPYQALVTKQRYIDYWYTGDGVEEGFQLVHHHDCTGYDVWGNCTGYNDYDTWNPHANDGTTWYGQHHVHYWETYQEWETLYHYVPYPAVMSDYLAAIAAGDLAGLATPPTPGGRAQLSLYNLHVQDNFLPLPPNAQIVVTVPDLSDPTTAQVVNTAGNLGDFAYGRASNFTDLLNTLADALGKFAVSGPFAQPVPFAGNLSLASLFDIASIQSRLRGLHFVTAEDLANQLAAAFGLSGADLVTGFDPATHELTYRVNLVKDLAGRFPLAGNINFSDLGGYDGNAELSLTGQLQLTFTLGMKLTGANDPMFIRGLGATGTLHLGADNISLNAQMGFLQVQSSGSSVHTDGVLTFGINQVTLGQLSAALLANNLGSVATLPVLTGTAQLMLQNISVPGSFITLPAGGAHTFSLTLPDLRSPNGVVMSQTGLGTVFDDFRTSRLSYFNDLVAGLAAALDKFRTTSFFGTPLPFVPGKTFDDAFNFVASAEGKFNQLTFTTVQDLASQLAAAFGLNAGSLQLQYDGTAHELTFRLTLSQTFDLQVPLGLNFASGSLAGLASDTPLRLWGAVNMSFTLGLKLGTAQPNDRLFVRDFTGGGEIHMQANAVPMSVRLGFLQLQSAGGTIQADGTLSFGLKQLGQPSGGTLTLSQLLNGINGTGGLTFSSIANLAVLHGSGSLTLPNLSAVNNLVTLPANANIAVTLADLSNPAGVAVAANNIGLAAAFNQVQGSDFNDLLSAVAGILTEFRNQRVFAQPLPFVSGMTVADAFNFIQTIQDKLNRLSFNSPQDLAAQLTAAFGLAGGSLVVNYDVMAQELTFQVVLANTFTSRVPVAFNVNMADQTGVTSNDLVSLTGQFNLSFTFGVVLKGQTPLSDQLFVRDFAATGTFHVAGSNLNLLSNLGFLQLQSAGTIQADGTLTFGLIQPGHTSGGTLTLTQLRNAIANHTLGGIATPPALTGTGQLVQALSVPSNLVTLPADAQITLTVPDLNDLTTTTAAYRDPGSLLDFKVVQTPNFVNLVKSIASVVGQFLNNPLFALQVPFAATLSWNDVFGFLTTIQNKFSGLTFTSAQDLTYQLAQAFGLSGSNLVASYNASTRELTYRVVLTQTFNKLTPLAYNGPLGALTGLSSYSQVNLTGTVTVSFTFGAMLGAGGQLNDDLFIRDFAATGSAHILGNAVSVSGTLGFLDIQSGGQAQTDAALSFGLKAPGQPSGGTLSLNQISNGLSPATFGQIANPATLTGTAQLTMQNLSVKNNLLPAPANGQLTFALPDVNDLTKVQVTAQNVDALMEFSTVQAQNFYDLIAAIQSSLDHIQADLVFNQTVPFASGQTVASVFGYLQTVRTKLNQLNFKSAQDLAGQLVQIFGLGRDTPIVAYNAAAHELTYQLNLTQAFDIKVPLAFNVDLGDLMALASTATADVSGQVNLSFTAGMTLVGNQPANDRLFVRNFAGGGTVTVAVDNARISGQLGIVQILSRGSTVRTNAALALSLHQPGVMTGGTLTLTQMQNALNGMAGLSFSAIAPRPAFTGSAQLVLQNVSVPGTLLSLPAGNTVVTATLADVQNPGSVSLGFTNAGLLPDFRALRFSDVTGIFTGFANYLNNLSSFSYLNFTLPFVNQTARDAIGYVTHVTSDISSFLTDPTQPAQNLENDLKAAFNLAASSNLISVTYGADHVLRFNVIFNDVGSQNLPFNVNLSAFGLAGLAGLDNLYGAGGTLLFTYQVALNFSLGLDLTNPSQPVGFVADSTNLVADMIVVGGGLDVGVQIGPAGLFIHNGTVVLNRTGVVSDTRMPADAAEFTASLKPRADHRYLPSMLVGDLTASQNVSLTGKAYLDLPFYLGADVLGSPDPASPNYNHLILAVNDLKNPTQVTNPRIPPFSIALNAVALKDPTEINNIITGLDKVLTDLQSALTNQVFGYVPFVGAALAPVIDFVGRWRHTGYKDPNGYDAGLIDLLTSRIVGQTYTDGFVVVQRALFDYFGVDLNILQPIDGTHRQTFVTDVQIDQSHADYIQVNLILADQGTAHFSNFDLGLPSLGTKTALPVQVSYGWTYHLGFGISRNNSFYVDGSVPNPLTFTMDVTIPNQLASGSLYWLPLNVQDDPNNHTAFHGVYNVNFHGLNDPNRLTLAELTRPGVGVPQIIRGTLTGAANAGLILRENLGPVEFPYVYSTFALRWNFNNAVTTGTRINFGDRPAVGYGDITLSVGAFIANFLGPIINQIKQVLAPIGPFLNLLNTRLPAISDVLHRDYTLLDLAHFLLPGVDYSFLDDVAAVYNFANSLPDGGNLTWDLGSFSLPSFDVRQDLATTVADIVRTQDFLPNWYDQLPSGAVKDFLGALTRIPGLALPILQDPKAIYATLLGKDVSFFTFDFPTLHFNLQMSQSQAFPVGPIIVVVTIYGGVDVNAHLKVGYDTYGLRRLLQTGDPAKLADGFYVDTVASYCNIRGYIGIQGSVNFLFVGGGVGAEIGATYNVQFVNPNGSGHLHGSEIADIVSHSGVAGLFTGSGGLYVKFYVFWQILLPYIRVYKWGVDAGFEWHQHVVWDFTVWLIRY